MNCWILLLLLCCCGQNRGKQPSSFLPPPAAPREEMPCKRLEPRCFQSFGSQTCGCESCEETGSSQ